MIYGAILGDIIGSRFEFDKGNKTKHFSLLNHRCRFTDDTVMTIAVAKAIPNTGMIKADQVIYYLKDFGRRYSKVGYGRGFKTWLLSTDNNPYNSYGNGSAMRCSSIAWKYNTIDEVRQAARITAEVTHNHPEGIKGAEAIASAIFLARRGCSKDKIKQYIEEEFQYDLNFTLDEIRSSYKHDSSCQGSVPQAIKCFLEGIDFEDVARNAVSIGGDTDTIACMACSIAEGYYEIPKYLKEKALKYLDRFLRKEVLKIEEYYNN